MKNSKRKAIQNHFKTPTIADKYAQTLHQAFSEALGTPEEKQKAFEAAIKAGAPHTQFKSKPLPGEAIIKIGQFNDLYTPNGPKRRKRKS